MKVFLVKMSRKQAALFAHALRHLATQKQEVRDAVYALHNLQAASPADEAEEYGFIVSVLEGLASNSNLPTDLPMVDLTT